jgi:hypothetical protein
VELGGYWPSARLKMFGWIIGCVNFSTCAHKSGKPAKHLHLLERSDQQKRFSPDTTLTHVVQVLRLRVGLQFALIGIFWSAKYEGTIENRNVVLQIGVFEYLCLVICAWRLRLHKWAWASSFASTGIGMAATMVLYTAVCNICAGRRLLMWLLSWKYMQDPHFAIFLCEALYVQKFREDFNFRGNVE